MVILQGGYLNTPSRERGRENGGALWREWTVTEERHQPDNLVCQDCHKNIKEATSQCFLTPKMLWEHHMAGNWETLKAVTLLSLNDTLYGSFKRYVKPGCKTRAVGVYMLSRTQEWGILSAMEIVIWSLATCLFNNRLTKWLRKISHQCQWVYFSMEYCR